MNFSHMSKTNVIILLITMITPRYFLAHVGQYRTIVIGLPVLIHVLNNKDHCESILINSDQWRSIQIWSCIHLHTGSSMIIINRPANYKKNQICSELICIDLERLLLSHINFTSRCAIWFYRSTLICIDYRWHDCHVGSLIYCLDFLHLKHLHSRTIVLNHVRSWPVYLLYSPLWNVNRSWPDMV